jgi:UDP-N-acetylglucosamine 2-epimerase (non-hydrolysing)
MKVITLLGTRPDIIRLSRVMAKLDQYFTHIMVHTGQNYDYELNKIFFDELEIRKPDYFLDVPAGNLAKTIGNIIANFDEVLEKEQPDAMLLLGDTNSALGIIPAKRRKIPIFHMEAGNRSFDQRVPEEINRKIVDHLADINLPYTKIAKSYLLNEGLPPDQVIVTGSPMREVLTYYKPKIDQSNVLNRLALEKGKYFVFSSHREENVDNKQVLATILDTIGDLYQQYKYPIIFTTHPRTREKVKQFGLTIPEGLRMEKPFGFLDYIKLQQEAACVISDSGTLTEEASLVGFPAVNLRTAHERPEGMEKMVAILSGLQKQDIIDSIQIALKLYTSLQWQAEERMVENYRETDVSSKIVGIIQSYTHYVNRKIWRKFL